MNMFARFDENPAMTLQDIKETKRYGRTDGHTHARTHGQCENSIPTTNKVCGGITNVNKVKCVPALCDNSKFRFYDIRDALLLEVIDIEM